MKALFIKANTKPELIDLENNLKNLQSLVGGYIECIYPFEDEVAIICNEEGKINGMPLNRALYKENGNLCDIIAGDFLVVGLTEEDFGSLSFEQIRKYNELFKYPEQFLSIDGDIYVVKIKEATV